MRKNIVTLSIIGMLLLSSFVVVSAGNDNEIIITISDIDPANESIDMPILYDHVSVHIEVENRSVTSPYFPGYLAFNWTIGGNNISTISGYSSAGYDTVTVDISGPLYNNTKINWYVNVSASSYGEKIYKNETFWFKTFNNQPVANFTNITHGLKVDFNGTLSCDSDGTIENYTWYFGDGSKGYGSKVQHIFYDNLTYPVSLNVTDDGGEWNNKTISVSVKNAAPIADFTHKADLKNVSFDASFSYDVDGSIVKYAWNFGDGNASSEMKPVHTFADEYTTYTVKLIVTDNKGNSTNISKLVTTNDTTLPTVKITKPERAFYMGNKKIRRLFLRMAFVIGSITVEVNASDSGSGIDRVEFYVNGKLKGNRTTAPYSFNWTKDRLVRFIHVQVLKVVAYDKYDNIASDKMLVKKFL